MGSLLDSVVVAATASVVLLLPGVSGKTVLSMIFVDSGVENSIVSGTVRTVVLVPAGLVTSGVVVVSRVVLASGVVVVVVVVASGVLGS